MALRLFLPYDRYTMRRIDEGLPVAKTASNDIPVERQIGILGMNHIETSASAEIPGSIDDRDENGIVPDFLTDTETIRIGTAISCCREIKN